MASVSQAPAAPPGSARPDRRLADVARSGLLNLVGAIVACSGTLGLTVIITRTFSPAAAGAFFTAMSLFLIIEAVATLGAGSGTVYFVARLRSLGQAHRVPEVLRAALRPVAAVSVIAAVLLAVFAAPAARLLIGGQLGHAGARPSPGGRRAAGPGGGAAVRGPARHRARRDPRLPGHGPDRAGGPDRPPGSAAGRRRRGGGGGQRRPAGAAVGAALSARGGGGVAVAAPHPALHPQSSPTHRAERAGSPCRTSGASPAPAAWPLSPRSPSSASTSCWSPCCAVRWRPPSTPPPPGSWSSASSATRPSAWPPQPRFTEMFAQHDHRGANRIYQVTTAWLILLTWPLYLLVISFGPQILERVRPRVPGRLGGYGDPRPDHAARRRVRAGRHGPGHHRAQQLEPGQRDARGGGQRRLDVSADPALRHHRRGRGLVSRDRGNQPDAADPAGLRRCG